MRSQHLHAGKRCRVALVTEELCSTGCSGGIGGAFHELALALARAGHAVDLYYVPAEAAPASCREAEIAYHAQGVRLVLVDPAASCWGAAGAEQKSYAVFRGLHETETPYDVVHFHDYKGIGFYSLAAKRQRLAFPHTRIVVQAHGPTRWTLQANGHPFTHPDQMRIDWMERHSIAWADILVSPSRYLLDWFTREGWAVPADTRVIQNICTSLKPAAPARTRAVRNFDEIVFYARHEERKGFVPFCEALGLLADELAERQIKVTFLGRFGEINGAPSVLALARHGEAWRFPLEILPDCNREQAAALLAARPGALLVIPSPVENSPYTVLEAILLGRPLITSAEGGASELLAEQCRPRMTCAIEPAPLAAKLREALAHGLPAPMPAIAPEATEREWISLHRPNRTPTAAHPMPCAQPTVTAAIVHHERPAKLTEALLSLAAQTYTAMDIVVVDDGSRTPETVAALDRLTPLLQKLGARLVRQDNLYLGAARNRAARESRGDYLLFLDDDDIAFPTLVQTLVTAAEATGAAVVNCLNLFMEESRRHEAFPFAERFKQKLSYLPLGGPLSLAPSENCFGAATALIRREAFERVGGYTELRGVGHEDYEFYVRLAQAGERIEICPFPLYLYETGRPSMISSTSRYRNFRRVADAIDPAALPGEAVRDLASLVAGQRAREHTENFRAYVCATSPHGDLLAALSGLPAGSAEYAARAAEYAARIGAQGVRHALRQVEAARLPETKVGEALPPLALLAPPAYTPRRPRPDHELIQALTDLAFGRPLQAAARCRQVLVQGPRCLPPLLLRVLDGLVEPEAARIVMPALRQLRLPRAVLSDAAPILLPLALAGGDLDFAAYITKEVREAEEASYLAAYPDVAEAVCARLFGSGFEHWATHREEGRTGFAKLSTLCAALEARLGLTAAPETLDDVLSRPTLIAAA